MNTIYITDKYVCFRSSIFSNWHKCIIKFANHTFHSSEQLFMYLKALRYDDNEIANKILNAKTPKAAKILGRQVKNFNQKDWNEIKMSFMDTAVYQKFMQNESLQNELLSKKYEGKSFVEGSPYDTVWGVGIEFNDPRIADEKNWHGQNLLGKTLDNVRRDIKNLKEINELKKEVEDLFNKKRNL